MSKLNARERQLLVIHAAVFGIRHAAQTFGIAPSAAHYWVHHPDYTLLHAQARERVERLAADMASEIWRKAA